MWPVFSNKHCCADVYYSVCFIKCEYFEPVHYVQYNMFIIKSNN